MFIRISNILMRSNVIAVVAFVGFFFEGFRPQNVLIFLFSMKDSYLLIAKITPGVNNFSNF